MMNHLAVEQITKTFQNFTALKDISFSIEKGEFICLLGPSGCGKTTLLRILAGLEMPNAGGVLMNGRDMTHLPPAERNFGIVFQSYALFPNLTAAQNVAYGLNPKQFSKKQRKATALENLKLVNLEQMADRYPAQLSGGQQQRVALARALAMNPEFLLLDEPLSALDAQVRLQLRNEIKRLQKQLGITTVMVTHDQEEALSMADRMIVMNNALIEQAGTPQEIYDRPHSPFVADFIGAVNFVGDQLIPNGEKQDVAVRPEHVTIHTHPSASSLPTRVENLEYRGSSYRVVLRQTTKDNVLYADIDTDTFKQQPLAVGEVVYAELQEDKVIFFHGQPEPITTKQPVLT
ncbi:ATP-binding cassette domain-containing protein [Halobacillus litoralis]|uniref:Carnitine transport ATP-binding protein OpuCA n=1 Tax=Halobacillus litoralis TaxID=45668 RepID=A0A845FCS4_9BACI|nr:ATP-binding cassette domain-containing protein [Halobacillus litoralis]